MNVPVLFTPSLRRWTLPMTAVVAALLLAAAAWAQTLLTPAPPGTPVPDAAVWLGRTQSASTSNQLQTTSPLSATSLQASSTIQSSGTVTMDLSPVRPKPDWFTAASAAAAK